MNIYFAEKLKKLRAEKKVSQEKLAQYLDVSSQAVSKWETGNAYPDITLLPDLARFFGVTVDELLCVENDCSTSILKRRRTCSDPVTPQARSRYGNRRTEVCPIISTLRKC